jgi:hypothetical protein
MEAIKGQLQLHLEIFKTLYDMEAFKEFTAALLRPSEQFSDEMIFTLLRLLLHM